MGSFGSWSDILILIGAARADRFRFFDHNSGDFIGGISFILRRNPPEKGGTNSVRIKAPFVTEFYAGVVMALLKNAHCSDNQGRYGKQRARF